MRLGTVPAGAGGPGREEKSDLEGGGGRSCCPRRPATPSPHVKRLKVILDKLDPPAPKPEPVPPMKSPGQPSIAMAKKRRR
jgi:hypothetical protein